MYLNKLEQILNNKMEFICKESFILIHNNMKKTLKISRLNNFQIKDRFILF